MTGSIDVVTSSWFVKLPSDYCRIGISRGVPRGQSGFRRYAKLNPGQWFKSVSPERYRELYSTEILAPLNAAAVLNDIRSLVEGKTPALLCWEPPTPGDNWCHRGLVAAWFKDQLNLDVFEYGHEAEGSGWAHPKLHPSFRDKR